MLDISLTKIVCAENRDFVYYQSEHDNPVCCNTERHTIFSQDLNLINHRDINFINGNVPTNYLNFRSLPSMAHFSEFQNNEKF